MQNAKRTITFAKKNNLQEILRTKMPHSCHFNTNKNNTVKAQWHRW